MTIEQFGQKIKQSHPEYRDLSDADVGQKVLTKYPEYRDMVNSSTKNKNDGYFSKIGSDLSQAGKDIANSVTGGAAKVASGMNEKNPFKSVAKMATGFGESALGAAGAASRGIFSPLTEAVAPIFEPVVSKLTDNNAAKSVINGINNWSQKHPEAATNLKNIFDIATAVGGVKAAKEVMPIAKETTAKVVSGVSEKLTARSLSKEAGKVWETVKPNLTKLEQELAVKEGKIQSKGMLGTIKQIPKGREIDMIEAARPYISKAKNEIEAVSKMKDAIVGEGTKLQSGLNQTKAIYNQNQIKNALNKIEPPVLISADSTLSGAYQKVIQKMLSITKGGKLGDLLQARRDFDAFVSKQFPNLYESETLTPMKQAIKDVRNTLNDVIESRLPEGKLPDGTSFRDSLKKQSLLYDAIDNTASKVGKVGTNKFNKFLKKHPTATKIGSGLVGGGALVGIGKSMLGE